MLANHEKILHLMVAAKLQEIDRQLAAHRNVFSSASEGNGVDKAQLIPQIETLATLVQAWNGCGKLDTPNVGDGKLNLVNLRFWLQQAHEDPSFNVDLLKDWKESLMSHIGNTGMKLDAAKLHVLLCDEWLKSVDGVAPDLFLPSSPMSDEYVAIEEADLEEKEMLHPTIVQEVNINIPALQDYLETLFSSPSTYPALSQLRAQLQGTHRAIESRSITACDVNRTIRGLLASSLLKEAQRVVLQDILGSHVHQGEIAGLLNVRVSTLDSWTWPKEGLLVHDSNDPSVYPELVEMILLHYLGVAWQVKLKYALQCVLNSGAWRRTSHLDDKRGSQHLSSQLADLGLPYESPNSVKFQRSQRQNMLFANRLQRNSMNAPAPDDSFNVNSDEGYDPASTARVKKLILDMLVTDTGFNTTVHGSHAMVRADLEPLENSLPHDAVLIILAFLGVPQNWLNFFMHYISMPLRFAECDQPRQRRRGLPHAFALSTFLSEAVLFVMDFAVNQRSGGLFLHRVSEEMWVWDADINRVGRAWEEITSFADLIELKVDTIKSGSAYIGSSATDSQISSLPAGGIRWGFLRFDRSLLRFVVDQEQISMEIQNLRQRLDTEGSESILGWVTTYNSYMAHILRNIGGSPAQCFNQAWIKDMVGSLKRIMRELFPDEERGVVGYLGKFLGERFGVHDMPEGYFYFPMARGGLGLKNVLLPFLGLQRDGKPLLTISSDHSTTSNANPLGVFQYTCHPGADVPLGGYLEVDKAPVEKKFRNLASNDIQDYLVLKTKWDTKMESSDVRDEFMSLGEYLSLREGYLDKWGKLYSSMLGKHERVDIFGAGWAGNRSARLDSAYFSARLVDWGVTDWETKWLVSMYGEGIVKKFGGLAIVEQRLVMHGVLMMVMNRGRFMEGLWDEGLLTA